MRSLLPEFLAVVALSTTFAFSPAFADETIGDAQTVINLVNGALAAGNAVTLNEGDEVFKDERLRTHADSSAKLRLRDNTNLQLGPSSSVMLDRFVYGGAGEAGTIGLKITKGALRWVTGDAAKPSYTIATPTATLGVRGTVLRILVTPSRTTVVLEEGAAKVCGSTEGNHACMALNRRGQVAVVTRTSTREDRSGRDPTAFAFGPMIEEAAGGEPQRGGATVAVAPVVAARPAAAKPVSVVAPPPPPPPPKSGTDCGRDGDSARHDGNGGPSGGDHRSSGGDHHHSGR